MEQEEEEDETSAEYRLSAAYRRRLQERMVGLLQARLQLSSRAPPPDVLERILSQRVVLPAAAYPYGASVADPASLKRAKQTFRPQQTPQKRPRRGGDARILDALPDDVVLRVLRCLRSAADVARFGATCRRAREIAAHPSLWADVDARQLRWSLAAVPALRAACVRLRCAEEMAGIHALVGALPRLRELDLQLLPHRGRTYARTPLTDAERRLADALRTLPQLQALTVRGEGNAARVLGGLHLPLSLERLRLVDGAEAGDLFLRLPAPLLGLRELWLEDDAGAALSDVAVACPNLTKLTLARMHTGYGAADMAELWARCTLLEDVELHFGSEEFQAGVGLFPGGFAPVRLRRLVVDCARWEDASPQLDCLEGVCAPLSQCSNLEDLCFTATGPKDIATLSSLTKLRRFATVVDEKRGSEEKDQFDEFGRVSQACVPLERLKLLRGNTRRDAQSGCVDLAHFFLSPRCRALVSLHISCALTRDCAWNIVLSSQSTLRKVTLEGGWDYCQFAIVLLSGLSNLETLKLLDLQAGFLCTIFKPETSYNAPVHRLVLELPHSSLGVGICEAALHFADTLFEFKVISPKRPKSLRNNNLVILFKQTPRLSLFSTTWGANCPPLRSTVLPRHIEFRSTQYIRRKRASLLSREEEDGDEDNSDSEDEGKEDGNVSEDEDEDEETF